MRFFKFFTFFFLFISICSAQESKLFELESIEFIGNETISTSELNAVIGIKESPGAISQFLNKTIGLGEEALYFDSLTLNDEITRLSNFYFNNGFFNAYINSEYALDSASMSASVKFYITENLSSYFKKINIYGIENINNEYKKDIEQFALVDTTERYSQNKVLNLNSNVSRYLRDQGFMFVKIDSTNILVDTLNNKVEVDMSLITGDRYKINELKLEKTGVGKDYVSDELIYELTGIKKGEYYSEYNNQRGQSRLYSTNLFNIAFVDADEEDTVGTEVPIQISTNIGSMHEFTPEIIMNNEDNVFNLGLGFGFSKKNFLGGARNLTFNASIASQNILEFIKNLSVSDTSVIGYSDLRLIMNQPFLFNEPIDTRIEVYSTLQKRKDEYNTTLLGTKISFNFELPPHVYLNLFSTSWNYEKLSVLYQESYLERVIEELIIQQFPDIPPEDRDSIATEIASEMSKTTSSNNTMISVNLGVNKTDNLMFPTKDFKISVLLANANFISYSLSKIFNYNFDRPLYFKWLLRSALFPRIYFSNKNAFGIKFVIGNINVYKGHESAVPYNQRYTAGGSNSVRGWESRGLVPKPGDLNFDYKNLSPADLEAILLDQAAPGGLFLLEGSFETRNRIIGNFGGALFLDYGNTWANAASFRWDEIAVAIGFGFRYYTGVIPLRLDFGFKFYDPRNPGSMFDKSIDDILQIHFGIGEAF